MKKRVLGLPSLILVFGSRLSVEAPYCYVTSVMFDVGHGRWCEPQSDPAKACADDSCVIGPSHQSEHQQQIDGQSNDELRQKDGQRRHGKEDDVCLADGVSLGNALMNTPFGCGRLPSSCKDQFQRHARLSY